MSNIINGGNAAEQPPENNCFHYSNTSFPNGIFMRIMEAILEFLPC